MRLYFNKIVVKSKITQYYFMSKNIVTDTQDRNLHVYARVTPFYFVQKKLTIFER